MGGLGYVIPKTSINQIKLVLGNGRTAEQVRQDTGASLVINAGFYDMLTGKPTHHLKIDGKVIAKEEWGCWGYAWNDCDIQLIAVPNDSFRNYIGAYELLTPMVTADSKLSYQSELGGNRGRTAIGLNDEALIVYCIGDYEDTSVRLTPEELRETMIALGATTALMLDGGDSSQLSSNLLGKISTIHSSRPVHNYFCIWVDDNNQEEDDKVYTVCLDPGHGKGCPNASPDGKYKEDEFAWDMYNRIAPLLVAQGINVVVTRSESTYPELTDRASISNNSNADCFVSLHTNAESFETPQWGNASGLMIYTSSGPENAPRNLLALSIIDQMKSSGISVRTSYLLHELYTVLVKTNAPACLIEYGFHTNKEDVELLLSATYRDKLAVATAKGICDWLGVTWKDVEKPSTDPDTPADWAKDDWDWAKQKGLLDGTRPTSPVTRQELAVVLKRFSELS